MMRKSLLPILFGALLLVTPALADEVVYFANGTSMPIVSHTVEEEMIHVDLGGGATMAFPIEQIDRVEDAEGKIALHSTTSNRMVPSTSGAQVQQGTVPPRHRRGGWEPKNDGRRNMTRPRTSEIERDRFGVATIRPFGGDPNSAKGRVRKVAPPPGSGQTTVESRQDGMVGTQKVGNRYVIPSNSLHGTVVKPRPVPLTARPTGSTKPGNNKK